MGLMPDVSDRVTPGIRALIPRFAMDEFLRAAPFVGLCPSLVAPTPDSSRVDDTIAIA
jgi:hypothetical protein